MTRSASYSIAPTESVLSASPAKGPAPSPAAAHPGAPAQAMAEFSCNQPQQIMAYLCELRDTAAQLALSGPGGHVVRASIWAVDPGLRRMSLHAEPTDRGLSPLVIGNECTAVAYLDQVKLQFELDDLMLVRGPRGTSLQVTLPSLLYRFQRRQSFRVTTLEHPAAVAELCHPDMPGKRLTLRVLDISSSGCALQWPADLPPLPVGTVIDAALQLDMLTRLAMCLRVQHVGSLGTQDKGQRLGCELVAPEPELSCVLQRYVDQLQRRRRLLAAD